MARVLVIGLDGFSPTLVDTWLSDLPNIRRIMQSGIHGQLESIIPAITPAAWTAMLSGRNPGHSGITDFTYRVGNSYTDFRLVHSRAIQVPTLATMLPNAGRRMLMIGVPISYPPITIRDGVCVSCFMAPSLKNGITQPREIQEEVLAQTSSPYVLDAAIPDHAMDVDRDQLLHQIQEMDRQRFDIAGYLMRTRPWDLLFMVCLGTDRIAHYFMRYHDPQHGHHDDDPRYQNVIRDHYRYCDERIGELTEQAGPDTVVMLVSDHGIQRLDGRVNLNQWLVEQGYLTLSEQVDSPVPLGKAPVDWSQTRAWAHGFGGQVYLNVRGREPQGVLSPADADVLLDRLCEQLSTLPGPNGTTLHAEVIRRRDIYNGPHADRCPDLFLRIEDLRYLTSDQVGYQRLATPVAQLGWDTGSHAQAGFLAMAGPNIPQLGRFAALHLLDVAPTVLDLLDISIPPDLDGHPIHKVDDVYSAEDEAELTNRLQAMYLK